MSDTEKRQLTPDDPVDAETLESFRRLHEAEARIARTLLSLEEEKIQILAAARRVSDQRNRLFESCLVDRGLPPDTPVEVDPVSGKLYFQNTEKSEDRPTEGG